jgi:hypothetical protein
MSLKLFLVAQIIQFLWMLWMNSKTIVHSNEKAVKGFYLCNMLFVLGLLVWAGTLLKNNW